MKILFGFLFVFFAQKTVWASTPLREQLLSLETGWELFKSDRNFSSEGESVELRSNGNPAALLQNAFLLSAEYGLTDVWAFIFRTGILSAQISPSGPAQDLSTGLGLTDTGLGFRWLGRRTKPAIGLEGLLFFPPYSVSDLGAQGLAIGDGVANFLLRVPLTARFKRVRFQVSPGFRFRFGRFSHQLLIDSSLSVRFKKFSLGVFQEGLFSITKNEISGGSNSNGEPGSGGSFSRLSLGPDLLNLGVKSGVKLSDKFQIEAHFAQSVWGRSAADGFRAGLQLSSQFDFFVPDNREKIKEVPLSSE